MTKHVQSLLIAIGFVMGLCGAGPTSGQTRKSGATKRAPTTDESVVATVGGTRITRAAFEQRFKEAEASYRSRSSAPLPAEFRPVMRRQVLEGMLREHLLMLESRRRGMGLTEEQAEEELKQDPFFRQSGMFDEAKFLAVKRSQPGRFREAVGQIQRTVPAKRLKEELDRQHSPDEASLRREITRQLTTVTIDYLALRRAVYAGDGLEPREQDVLDYYRTRASEFLHPARAKLTIVFVHQPPRSPDSDESAVRAWDARMQQRADSLLGALKRGGKLEDLATPFGDLKRNIVVERGNFPSFWRGGSRTRDAVFSAAAGTVLPEAIPADPGRLIVRVDEHVPAGVAPLREVAGLIRATLRAQLASGREDRGLQAIFAATRDSLRGLAYRIRYAVADTGVFGVPEPTASELDRYYRGHQADYTRFDKATSSIITRPFAEVREDVRRRLLRDRRQAAAGSSARQLLAAWNQGKQDRRLERAMTALREVGPIPAGGAVDTGLAGATLSDSLSGRPGLRAGLLSFPRGWLVFHVFEEIKDHAPTFEQSRPLLVQRRSRMIEAAEEAGGRKLYEEDPQRFRANNVIRFSRLMVEAPEVSDIPLTREEVETWYQTHIEEYGAPELARVRHILISPRDTTPEADREAREKAESVLRRVREGEDFASLVRQFSDDEATQSAGGDVGVFRHGMMLEEFERVAFTMSPGDIRGPVRTEVGYHIMECLEHVPAEVVPLKYCYANVAAGAAGDKARRIARFRADSLHRKLKSPVEAHRLGRREGYLLFQNDHVIGTPVHVADLKEYFARLETLKPGQFHPMVQEYRGMGWAITWVDSLLPPRVARWEEVQREAIDLYRREADRRKMLAKRAELDSLLASGWSFDSLATLFGGFERYGPLGPGKSLERLGGSRLLDSLAFGAEGRPPVLQPGRVTDWIEFPGGLVRLRLVERHEPAPVQLAGRLENERRLVLERNLRQVFDKLKQRFPVEILDRDLRITELPPLTES